MSAARKRKKKKKSVRFEVSRLALTGWCFGLLLALIWMFLLGLFVGKGITPANINFTEIKKRMMAEGIWPGSGETDGQKTPPPRTTEKRKIAFKDLEFYEKLAKKKEAQLQNPAVVKTPPTEKPSTTVAAKPPPPAQRRKKSSARQKPSTNRFTVQLASFKDLTNAKKFAARFRGLKHKATIREVELSGKGRWYRVQVGKLASREEATALANHLAKKYQLHAFVIGLGG
ncbi:MAG: SPOR domain-containing protein [Deltaproteobacteria bacterium]|jgi:cell division protein FtsN|nr:MAG: SPOR domain-containing protein [Deltaproteobacteria bacterium]